MSRAGCFWILDHFYLKLFVDNYLLNFADSWVRGEVNKVAMLHFFFKRINAENICIWFKSCFMKIENWRKIQEWTKNGQNASLCRLATSPDGGMKKKSKRRNIMVKLLAWCEKNFRRPTRQKQLLCSKNELS